MFRSELSTFLLRVLDAVASRAEGISLDVVGEPELASVDELARELSEAAADVRSALIGLNASHCLMEESVEFPGIEAFGRWMVHPQCTADDPIPKPTTWPS